MGAGFSDCKSGQEGIQNVAALGISNRGKKKLKRGRDYKPGQGFQIGAGITSQGRTTRDITYLNFRDTEKIQVIRNFQQNTLSILRYCKSWFFVLSSFYFLFPLYCVLYQRDIRGYYMLVSKFEYLIFCKRKKNGNVLASANIFENGYQCIFILKFSMPLFYFSNLKFLV